MADLAFLKQFTKGDVTKMKRYIQLFLDVAPGTFQEMERNTAQGSREQLRINAHSLKPQAEFMGMPDLKSVLIQIENKAETSDTEILHTLIEEATLLYEASINTFEDFLSKD